MNKCKFWSQAQIFSMFNQPSCHRATHTLLLPESGLYHTTIMCVWLHFISETGGRQDLCFHLLSRGKKFYGGVLTFSKGDFCGLDVFQTCEIRLSCTALGWSPEVLIGMWLPVMSHHRNAGCFSVSVAVCKHMDPTDGNIVPSSPEQVTWRSASEVRVHRRTLQNKNSHQMQVWAMTMWLIVAMVIWSLR